MTNLDWFLTSSGRRLFLTNPDPDLIIVEDIAHALAHLCRFGGHCSAFYSVAEHSVLVSRLVPPALAFQGLMHDATEAYLSDLIRPLKRLLPDYRELEDRWWSVIAERFGLPKELDPLVKHADLVALATERQKLMSIADPSQAPGAWQWKEDELGVVPSTEWLVYASHPRVARHQFLERFRELCP